MNIVKAIFLKEMRVEFRNKQMINSYLILALLILVSFRFGFIHMDLPFEEIAAPILWITFFFSGMFSLSLTYKREVENGTQSGLLLAPISPAAIYFGKFFANLILLFGLELFSILFFFIFFPIAFPDIVALLTVLIVGTVGFSALGNIISAISANLQQSAVMLPVLLIPILLFTIVMSAVSATAKIFAGGQIFDIQEEIKYIVAFDLVYLAIGYLLIDYILKA